MLSLYVVIIFLNSVFYRRRRPLILPHIAQITIHRPRHLLLPPLQIRSNKLLIPHALRYHPQQNLILHIGPIIHTHLFRHILLLSVFPCNVALLLPELAFLLFFCHELVDSQGAGFTCCARFGEIRWRGVASLRGTGGEMTHRCRDFCGG
jgi:hypothetical protein